MNAKNESASKSTGKRSARKTHAPEKSVAASGRDRYPREKMIAEAAYYHAKQRGFAPENEIADWILAEAEVDSLLRSAQT
jgi:hypothetical protein